MKSKIFIFLIFFIVFVSSCAKFKGADAYLYIPEYYLNSAQSAYDNGNISAALMIAKKKCDNLDFESCNLLGIMSLEGKYTSQSDSTALRLFTKGCVNKYPASCLYLGKMYDEGRAVNINDKKRDTYYQMASTDFLKNCQDNKSSDCMQLGLMYLNNYIYDPYEEGLNYIKKSCSMGYGKGCAAAGDYYFYNMDNKTEAFYFYEKACANHNPEGCLKLIDMYNTYKFTELNNARNIIAQSEKMCKSGASNLCVYLGNMYKRYTRISRIDKEKSYDYIFSSCDFNNPYGCKLLGDMYSIGYGVAENEGSALRYYDKACQLGFTAACTLK